MKTTRVNLAALKVKPIEVGAVTYFLPMPVSTNRIWRSLGRGHVTKSKEYRDWIKAAYAIVGQSLVRVPGPVCVHITVYPEHRRGDLDNKIKGLMDLLVSSGVIEKDNMIGVTKIEIEYHPPSGELTNVVRVRVYTQEKP